MARIYLELGQWHPIERLNRASYFYQQDPTPSNLQKLQEAKAELQKQRRNRPPYDPEHYKETRFFREGYSIFLMPHPRYMPIEFHDHDFFEMIYVHQGGCENLLEHTALPMVPGDLCILPPNQRHAVKCFRDDGIIINILIRTSTFLRVFQSLLTDFGLLSTFFSRTLLHQKNSDYLLFHCGEDTALDALILEMYREHANATTYSSGLLSGQLMQLLALLMRSHSQDVETSVFKDQPVRISEMLQYMEAHLTDVTLRQIAQHFNYSEGYCSTIIKEATGKNFNELIRERRAKYAAKLLQETDMSLVKVAETAGFYDTSHMSKVFISLFGISPSKYRKRQKDYI